MITIIDHGPVRELRFNHPPANALSPELIKALLLAVNEAPRQGAHALVLSGSPGRFSAGLDVPHLLTLDRSAMTDVWRSFYSTLRAIAASPIPIAAAVTGHAPAGGAVLCLFCDHRVMADGEFIIGLNEVQVGLQLPPVIFLALRRLVGPRHAARLAIGGLLISPAEALNVGMVDDLAPADHVTGRALEWCQAMLKVPRHSMLATRKQARADLVAFFDQADAELEQVMEMWWNPEAQAELRALVARLAAKKKGA